MLQIHKIIGFAPTLLQVVMSTEVEMPVRQAGAIYLKNLISSKWAVREADNGPVPFSIHEQDRAMIRDAIVDAVVHAPELIRQVHLLLKYIASLTTKQKKRILTLLLVLLSSQSPIRRVHKQYRETRFSW